MNTGYVYLLHFSAPVGNPANRRAMATHYTGWALDPEAREREHRAGRGARLTAVAIERGISWELFILTAGDRALERQIKLLKAGPRLCPICGVRHPRGLMRLPGAAQQLALFDVDPFELPAPASAGYDAYEHLIRRSWQQPQRYPVADDADCDLPY